MIQSHSNRQVEPEVHGLEADRKTGEKRDKFKSESVRISVNRVEDCDAGTQWPKRTIEIGLGVDECRTKSKIRMTVQIPRIFPFRASLHKRSNNARVPNRSLQFSFLR
jgi:hypothetical protein